MLYLVTLVRYFTNETNGRIHRGSYRSHLEATSRREAERMVESLSELFDPAETRVTVSVKVFRPEGGSIVMELDDWYRICESLIGSDGQSTGKPSMAAE